jgi:hypothetical protein
MSNEPLFPSDGLPKTEQCADAHIRVDPIHHDFARKYCAKRGMTRARLYQIAVATYIHNLMAEEMKNEHEQMIERDRLDCLDKNGNLWD